jgi:hypothetical protein
MSCRYGEQGAGQVRAELARDGEELSHADESVLYHHYELNYTPPNTERGRRLPRG